jgi:dCTP deaminase
MYLSKQELDLLISNGELAIRPLLEENQIGPVTIDFRLGVDFLVSIQGRNPYIQTINEEFKNYSLNSFFQSTRRKIGESFLLHPNQTVLCTSLEYVKIPNDVMLILNMRSSFARLGIHLSTIVQPGYKGTISLELTNNNKNPINLTVGACVFQCRFVKIANESNYFSKERKYMCQVKPQMSAVKNDEDNVILQALYDKTNKG